MGYPASKLLSIYNKVSGTEYLPGDAIAESVVKEVRAVVKAASDEEALAKLRAILDDDGLIAWVDEWVNPPARPLTMVRRVRQAWAKAEAAS